MATFGNGGFDATQHEPADFTPLPAGKYLAAIAGSEMKPTKNSDGHYLYLTFQILEGQYKGRKVWDRLNLHNKNPAATAIAKGQLSAICRAIGVMTPKDSQELHNVPLVIDVRLKKRNESGDFDNEIRGYSKRDGAAQVGSPTPTAPAGAAASAAAPWKR